MHTENIHLWQHGHTFGQEEKRRGEPRTSAVIAITATMMGVEVASGVLFGSMALLADGLHMASHAAALAINAFAYVYARREARSASYSYGTGKVNALGGFSGAVLLAVFAVLMAGESLGRLVHPVEIAFNYAILVAVLGLAVNGASAFILGPGEQGRNHGDRRDRHHQDLNLRSAYLHVVADALTSILAILALLAAKYLRIVWMDPAVAIIGAVLVARWSISLLRATSGVLLDRQGPEHIRRAIKERLEEDKDTKLADLHLWSIGPGRYALTVAVVAHRPSTPEEYKQRMPKDLGLAHVSIEIHECPGN